MLARYLALLYTGQRSLPKNYKSMTVEEGAALTAYYTQAAHLHSLVDYPIFMSSMARLIGCEPRPPSFLFNMKRWIQYYTFPTWPVFYRTRGPGANPAVVESVMSKFETWAAKGPSDHPLLGPMYRSLWKGLLLTFGFKIADFIGLGFLFGGNSSYWARSRLYNGLHGHDLRWEDLVRF